MFILKKLAALLLALTLAVCPITIAHKEESEQAVLPPQSEEMETLPQPPIEDSTENEPPAPAPIEPTPKPETPPTPEPNPEPVVSYANYIRCTGENVNIRSGAGTSYTALGVAEKDTVYAITGKIGNWYEIGYKNKKAYIYASYVAVFSLQKSENERVEAVLNEGYKLLGVTYVYGAVRFHDGKGNLLGGFTAQKFDCSSLVQYMFYQGAGEILDVTTRTQVKQGKYVAKNDLKRGDCMFFTNESRAHLTGNERVGHVAVYLGNNYILHTASDYARIEQISAKRWSYYIESRRFL